MRRAIICILSLAGTLSAAAQTMEEDFANPPLSARVSTYWMWMNGNISREGITADLEYMHRTGYGGAMIFNTGVGIPFGGVEYGSDEWVGLTRHACAEADRLGLELWMHNSPGYSSVGGRWIAPEESAQQIVWSDTTVVVGPGGIHLRMPQPPVKEGFYRDIRTLAYPSSDAERTAAGNGIAAVEVDGRRIDPTLLSDRDLSTQIRIDGGEILIRTARPMTLQAISLWRDRRETPRDPHDGPRDYGSDYTVEVSADGETFTVAGRLSCPPLRSADTPGCTTFAPVECRFVRLSTRQAAWVAEIELHASPRLDGWQLKSGILNGRIPAAHSMPAEAIDPATVVDISAKMSAGGVIEWPDAPAGCWTIVRTGHTTTGQRVTASPDGARGLEADKFSSEGVDAHFDKFVDPLMHRLAPYAGRTLTGLVIDSWEAGRQSWTERMPERFRSLRGYDIGPMLLAMTGRIVRSAEATEAFLRDMRRTQADLFTGEFMRRFRERSAALGLRTAGEAYGDGNFESTEYAAQFDIPMSEFWTHYIYGSPMTTKLAASAADIYGRRTVAAECFTGTPFNAKYTEHPYGMKALGDWMMAVGANRFVLHTFAHQPLADERAVMTMGPFGSHLDRRSAWAGQADGWNAYNARCAALLQRGRAVRDILYVEEREPSSGIADRDLSPHAPPAGYRWNAAGEAALLSEIVAHDGKAAARSGMEWRIVAAPDSTRLSAEAAEALKRMARAGVPVVAPEELHAAIERLGLLPDFEFEAERSDAQIHFAHRTLDEGEIYFIANHRRRPERLHATFRTGDGLVPEMWNPETGRTGIPVAYTRSADGRTTADIRLDECGSCFVIFRREGAGILRDRLEPLRKVATPHYKGRFTVNAWLKPETHAHPGRGMAIYPEPGGIGLGVGNDVVRMTFRDGTRIRTALELPCKIEGWAMVTITVDDGTATLYIDGRKAGTAECPRDIASSAGVPATEEHYTASFEGDMTDPQLFGEAWSAARVAAEYAAGRPETPLPDGHTLIRRLDDGWEVSFPEWSGAKPVRLDTLRSLHLHPDFDIAHFGGQALYRRPVTLSRRELKRFSRLVLDLGGVEVIASVKVDGHDCGTRWKAPYAFDLTDVLHAGRNDLEVTVTVLYPNRMIGDEHLPAEAEYDIYGHIAAIPRHILDGKPPRRKLFATWRHYSADDPLHAAGLTGGVRLTGTERAKKREKTLRKLSNTPRLVVSKTE